MNRTRSIPYRIDAMPAYVVDQLAAGNLPTFLPVSFVFDQKSYTGVYDTANYRPLAAISQISTKEMLWIFCQLIGIIAENEKHYFFGETYQINVHTVYVDLMRSQIKLVFAPTEEPCSTKQQLCDFLHTCKAMVSEESIGYLDDMIKYLNRDEVGYLSAIHHGEQLQHEIYACDVQ